MQPASRQFRENARQALKDPQLQQALGISRSGFVDKRRRAADALPEFEALRDQARDIKTHTLAHLDLYLEAYEQKVIASGGTVHWCETPEQACRVVERLCRELNVTLAAKSKSMITEEIGLNAALRQAGITPVETDLGEYIVQLRQETPSHILAPAVHVTKEQIAADFRRHHKKLPEDRRLDEAADLVSEARQVLRQTYFEAGVGITGANFLIAETGASVLVTNEGNGDLVQLLPKAHIVVTSIDKIVPTLEDASTLLRVLARSATGQDISAYTTFSAGLRQPGDPDGPEHYHVVLLDNGRSALLGSRFQEVLRCIRCGACMNHCPVYQAIGGHAYGWVYPGPIGAALNPALIGLEQTVDLPHASTLCGRCQDVCPMRIPLPKILRYWREQAYERHPPPPVTRYGLGLWTWLLQHPRAYRMAMTATARLMALIARGRGRLRHWPLAAGWTASRDLPAPEGQSFISLWKQTPETAE